MSESNDDAPQCDERGCGYKAKYRHSWMQGEMEMERHWCGIHAGERKYNLEKINDE